MVARASWGSPWEQHQSFETLKPVPSDTLSPTWPYLQILPKQFHHFFSGSLFPDISSFCHIDIKLDSTMAQAICLRILYYLPLPSVLKDFHPFLPKSILECPKVLFLYHPCSFISQLEYSNLCWPHYGKQYLKWKPYQLSQGNKIADKGDRESYCISYGIGRDSEQYS